MDIGAVFSSIVKTITDKAAKGTKKFEKLSKEDVITLITQNIETHTTCVNVLSAFDDQLMNKWYVDKVSIALKDATDKAKDVYDKYAKNLSSKASAAERKRFLSSLCIANTEFISVLNEIMSNIDEIFTQDTVTIYDTHISHLTVLGLIKESTRVALFTEFLYSYLVKVTNNMAAGIPRYREAFMLETVNDVAKTVNKIIDGDGYFNYRRDIEGIKRHNADLVLGANGKLNNINQYANTVRHFYTPNVLDTIMSALSTLNIFDHLMNFIDDYKVARNRRNRETKEWLEGHVALLNMELSQMDATSPEYTKLVNIIKAYDVKISEYDEEIEAFENGK